MNKKIKLSDYVAEFISKYSSHVFVGQGGSVVHLLDSIDRNKKLENISSQNEQAAAIAADAYARVKNKIGFCIATSGPGILNLFQGIACSYYDSIPTISISGAVATDAMKDRKIIRQAGFQQMDVVNMVKSFTKYATMITKAEDIKYELEKAVYIATSGRPGPIVIDLPDDIQRALINPSKLKSYNPPKEKNKISVKIKNDFKKLKKYISNASRPLVIVGHGVNLSNTKKEVINFLKKNNLPFCATWGAVDIFSEEKLDNQNIGLIGVAATRYGNFAVQNADLILCLGTRLNTQITGTQPDAFAPLAKKIVVDIDRNEFKKTNKLKIDLKFNTDLKLFMKEALKINFKEKQIKNDERKKWLIQIDVWKKKYPIIKKNSNLSKNFIDPYVFMDMLSSKTQKNDIIIPDASANLIYTYQGYSFKNKQQMFTALNHSPMGYSVPASIGAQLAEKKSNVIAIIGDGSMQMNIQELQTIYNLNLPIKIFIINNGGYGLIKQTQETWLRSNYVGVDASTGLGLPNFQKVGKSYGIDCVEIKNHNELDEKLNYVLKSQRPIICDVVVSPKQRVAPKLEFGRVIDDMSPLLSRAEYNSNKIK